jgi:hypothetical protein
MAHTEPLPDPPEPADESRRVSPKPAAGLGETGLQAGYETRDVGPRGIVLLGAGLVVVTAFTMLLLGWLFNRLEARAVRSDPPESPLADEAGPPPGPQLELNLKFTDYEQADRSRLESYGWADKEQRVVHIPIERAMQLLAERGLPEPAGPVNNPPKP